MTNCVPKFGFAKMGYLMLAFERPLHRDLKISNLITFEWIEIF